MVDMNPRISKLSLNMNDINTAIKNQVISMNRKTRPKYLLSTKRNKQNKTQTNFRYVDTG